jgi:hypothetical protein
VPRQQHTAAKSPASSSILKMCCTRRAWSEFGVESLWLAGRLSILEPFYFCFWMLPVNGRFEVTFDFFH